MSRMCNIQVFPEREFVCPPLPPSSQNVECEYIKVVGVNLGCAVNIEVVGVDRECPEAVLSLQPWRG